MKKITIIISTAIVLVISLLFSACSQLETEIVLESQNQETKTIQEAVTEVTKAGESQATTENITKATANKEKAIVLNKSYTTRYSEVNSVEYPNFVFDYNSNWTVTKKDVTDTQETVVLSNNRGVTITFTHIGGIDKDGIGGGSTVLMSRVKISKAGNSQFTPTYVQATDYSEFGKFIVAKLKVTGELNMKADSDFKDIDGDISYAVLPKSRIGIDDSVTHADSVEFAFWYSGYISFIAKSPNGRFSKDEQREILSILSSFRTKD